MAVTGPRRNRLRPACGSGPASNRRRRVLRRGGRQVAKATVHRGHVPAHCTLNGRYQRPAATGAFVLLLAGQLLVKVSLASKLLEEFYDIY